MATVTIEIDGQTRKIPVDLPEGYTPADVQAQVREYLTKNPAQSSTTREANAALSGTGLDVSDHAPPKPYALASPKDQASRKADPRKALKRDIIPYEGEGSVGGEDIMDGLSSMATDRPATGAAQIAGGVLSGMGPFVGGRGITKGIDAAKNIKMSPGEVASAVIERNPKVAILKGLADRFLKKTPAAPPEPPPQAQWGSGIPMPPQTGPNLTVNPAGNGPSGGTTTPLPGPGAPIPMGTNNPASMMPMPPKPTPAPPVPGPQSMPVTPPPGPGGTVPGGTAGPASSIPMPPVPAPPPTAPGPQLMPKTPPPGPGGVVPGGTANMPGSMPMPPQELPKFGGSTNARPTPIPPPKPTPGPPAAPPSPVLSTVPAPSTAPPPSSVPGTPSTTASTPVPSTGPPLPPAAEELKNMLGGTPGQPLVIPGSGPGAGEAAHLANRTSLVDRFLNEFKTNSPKPLEEISKLSEPEKSAIRDSIASGPKEKVGGPDTQKLIFERLGITPPAAIDAAPGAPVGPGAELPKFAKGGIVVPGESNQCWNLGALEGQTSPEAIGKIHRYIIKQPNVKLPGKSTTTPGESFNSFKRRFLGTLNKKLQELKSDPGKKLNMDAHHWDTRLVEAWAHKGYPASMEISTKVMTEKGDSSPGSALRVYWRGTKPALEKVNMSKSGSRPGGVYLIRNGDNNDKETVTDGITAT